MRAFVALPLTGGFRDDVIELQHELARFVEGRWSPPENLHVTLAFLGDIDEAACRACMDTMDESTGALRRPVVLSAKGLGAFRVKKATTLFLELACDPGLTDLAEAVRASVRARGIPLDERRFRPHITLARRAGVPAGTLGDLPFPLASCEGKAVTLFRSFLEPTGPRYKPLYEVPLPSAHGFAPFSTPESD